MDLGLQRLNCPRSGLEMIGLFAGKNYHAPAGQRRSLVHGWMRMALSGHPQAREGWRQVDSTSHSQAVQAACRAASALGWLWTRWLARKAITEWTRWGSGK